MKLIDADALMEIIRQHDYPLTAHINSTDKGMFTDGIQQAVDEMPTIDPIHAAGGCYCRECKYHGAAGGPMQCDITDDNDFCSHDERREGEEK